MDKFLLAIAQQAPIVIVEAENRLKPKLVAAIDYAELMPANHLRHSKFVALWDDKSAKDVSLEKQ